VDSDPVDSDVEPAEALDEIDELVNWQLSKGKGW